MVLRITNGAEKINIFVLNFSQPIYNLLFYLEYPAPAVTFPCKVAIPSQVFISLYDTLKNLISTINLIGNMGLVSKCRKFHKIF